MKKNVPKNTNSIVNKLTYFLTGLGILTCIYHLFNISIAGIVLWPKQYYAILIICFLPLVFLKYSWKKNSPPGNWIDYFLAFVSFCCGLYILIYAQSFEFEGWEINPPWHALVAGVAFCILIFDACRRVSGWAFPIIALIFLIYPFFAEHMPSFLMGRSVGFKRAIGGYVCGNIGPFGIPMQVVGDILIGFLFFAVALMVAGGGQFFLTLASAILGKTRGGPAKVAVIASSFFSSMSGSVVANVATTGSITIPAMKKIGYPNHYAGAVEACASTGGTLMPPIMGAAAFIMCTILGVSYSTVVIAAFIPSVLYYMTLLIQVDAFAAKQGMKGMDTDKIPNLKQTIIEGWPYIVSISYLIWGLVYLRAVATTPFYAGGMVIILTMFSKKTRLDSSKISEFMEKSTKTVGEILVVLLAVGFIIGGLTITGTANAFAREVVELTGGNALLLLIFGALTSFVLGMGMTITACYVFLAVTMAPPLIEIGFNPLAVHLFVMYYGMISYITPPVALGAFAASSIADANPMQTAIYATKLGMAKFIIPFLFVASPGLVFQGNPSEILVAILRAFLGLFIMSTAFEGYFIGLGRLKKAEIGYFIVGGFAITFPNLYLNVFGTLLTLVGFLSHYMRNKKKQIGENEANDMAVS